MEFMIKYFNISCLCLFIKCIFPLYLSQLIDASTLKKEVAEGVDLMVVRELTGGVVSLNLNHNVAKHPFLLFND